MPTEAVAAEPKFIDVRRMRRTLRDIFGIEHLRRGQRDVIRAILEGRDALALMPTGAGKSLCYQLPALYLSGMTIVISPLISLMRDQAEKLDRAGVAGLALNSTLSHVEEAEALQRIQDGAVKVVFVTPERFVKNEFLTLCASRVISLIVIDEAHCISEWGHDFRPDYLEIGQAIKALGRPPVLALTATATHDVVSDVVRHLKMTKPLIVNTGVLRENLHFSVCHVTDGREKTLKIGKTLDFIANHAGSGIVYAATIKEVERFFDALHAAGISVVKYHGKLTARERTTAQDAFMLNQARIIVATNAFGMGIDKPDIRFILHAQMPGSLESYYQEAGRGGRDGAAAHCCLLFDFDDRRIQAFFLSRGHPGAALAMPLLEQIQRLTGEEAYAAGVSMEALDQAMPDCPRAKLQTALTLLADAGLIKRNRQRRYHVAGQAADASAKMVEANQRMQGILARHQEAVDRDRHALDEMIRYAQSAQCRWKTLLDYFDCEAPWTRCGKCDNCLHPLTLAPSNQTKVEVSESATAKPRFAPGDLVRIRRFGEAHIIDVVGDAANVMCRDGTIRQFLMSYLKPMRRITA